MIFSKFIAAVVGAACTIQSANADSIFKIVSDTDDLSTLEAALVQADFADALSCTDCAQEYTLFAPTNVAFGALPPDLVAKLLTDTWKPQLQDVLNYHLLAEKAIAEELSDGLEVTTENGEDIIFTLPPSSTGPKVNDANITETDILADNGVIHKIDAVLVPTSVTQNLVQKLVANLDTFGTLVELVVAADLGGALSGDGPFTVFAPTDEAFANLFESFPGVEEYLDENIDVLREILLLHVASANADSVILKESAEPFGGIIKIPTLSEDFIKVTVSDDGSIMINDSNVILANIIANNGVAHAIDGVLLPDGFVFPPESSSKSAKRGTYSPTTDSLPRSKSDKGGKRQQSMMGLERMRLREHRVSTDEDEETLEESEQSMLF